MSLAQRTVGVGKLIFAVYFIKACAGHFVFKSIKAVAHTCNIFAVTVKFYFGKKLTFMQINITFYNLQIVTDILSYGHFSTLGIRNKGFGCIIKFFVIRLVHYGGFSVLHNNRHLLISVNGKTVRASYDVKLGDIIEVGFGTRIVKVKVESLNETPTKENAAGMYSIVD